MKKSEGECKSCQYCDIYDNLCLRNMNPCYYEGKCLQKNCEKYKEGDYFIKDADGGYYYEYEEKSNDL